MSEWKLKVLRWFGLYPLKDAQRLWDEVGTLQTRLCTVEAALWNRYKERLRNDVHMILSGLYTEHTKKCSLGIPETETESTWPYYKNAVFLIDRPVIGPERLGSVSQLIPQIEKKVEIVY